MKRIIIISIFSLTASFCFAQLKELNQTQLYENVLNIYDEGDDTYKDDKPCVVLFFSPYCQYSKIMEKNINAAAKKFKNDIHFYKVNVFRIDDYTMQSLGIEGTPYTGIWYNGEFELQGGVATQEEIEEVFELFM
ncbi:MAG: thioredoxin family protein [Prevotellaceae bacterium]|jgi:thiol-disulfide isomerase/thioredoxin|nr:thioredoxin family protein [Prevotellaceae bacterium]